MWRELVRTRAARSLLPVALFSGTVMPALIAGPPTSAGEVSGVLNGAVVDSFSGPRGSLPDRTRWGFELGDGGFGNGVLNRDTASTANAHLDGHGHLVITALRTGSPGHYAYTSARLFSLETVGPTLHAEARIKMPAGVGLWPTFWLLGGEPHGGGWPVTGEVDVAEMVGKLPKVLFATAHGFAINGNRSPDHWQSVTHRYASRSYSSGYHLYAVDVTTDTITWSVDHHAYKVLRRSQLPGNWFWSFNTPMHVLLSLDVGGAFAGPPAASTRFPTSMTVDYVRVTGTG